MRHRKLSRRFSRTSSHRIAMMRNLSISLIEHEIIKTTVEKGKELRRFIEPLITRAKEDNLHNRRLVISELNSKKAAKKLFSDLGPRFKETNGGYLRLIKAGFREGDKADICFVELTHREDSENGLPEESLAENKLEKDLQKQTISKAKEPEVKKADTKEPEVKKADTKEPEVKKADTKEPEVKKADTKEPEVKKADTKEPVKKKEKAKESWWSRFFK